MKRSAIKRTSPLRPGTKRLERKTRLRLVNPQRRAKKHRRNFAGPVAGESYAVWIRTQHCLVTNCRRRDIQAAHLFHARGMGGCNGDWRELCPLCSRHHEEQERGVQTFLHRHQTGLFMDRFHAFLPAWEAFVAAGGMLGGEASSSPGTSAVPVPTKRQKREAR